MVIVVSNNITDIALVHVTDVAVQLSGDEHIKSSNYFLSNGFEALKTGMQKKFVKNVYELIVSYYREKKNNIKRKQKKLINGQP